MNKFQRKAHDWSEGKLNYHYENFFYLERIKFLEKSSNSNECLDSPFSCVKILSKNRKRFIFGMAKTDINNFRVLKR